MDVRTDGDDKIRLPPTAYKKGMVQSIGKVELWLMFSRWHLDKYAKFQGFSGSREQGALCIALLENTGNLK